MTAQTSPLPSWLDAFVDIAQARRRAWLTGAAAVLLIGALVALLAPSLLPPTWIVGAIVGLAAVVLACALVVGLDSADIVVRGPRHITAAGGTVATTISRAPSDIDALMQLVDRHAGRSGSVRLALTPASRTAGVPGARANMIAEELARRDLKVLCTDLTRGRTPAVGLSDVLDGSRKLAEAVRFDEDLFLAHLAVGSEPDVALAGFTQWATSLPADLDVLVAALPPLAEPGVLQAVQGVELVLVLVEIDRTERVDLIASLDAIDAAGVPAHLVLVDPSLDTAAPSTSVAVLDRAPDGEIDDLHGDETSSASDDGAALDSGDDRSEADDGSDVDDDAADTSEASSADDTAAAATAAASSAGAAATASSPATTDEASAPERTQSARTATSDKPASSTSADNDGPRHVRTVPAPARPATQPTPVQTPSRAQRVADDDIDETARESARLTAALHDLAAQVWDRQDTAEDGDTTADE